MYPPHLQRRYEQEELLREEFDRWAQAGRGPEMETQHRRVTEKTIELMELGPDERILDLGCGDGWASRLLSPLCPEGAIVGVDISNEMIRLAREKSVNCENVLFVPGSAEEIPWAEAYFTRVISIESAYYWPSLEGAGREIFRVTAFGGRIYHLLSIYEENPSSRHLAGLLDIPAHLRSAAEWAEPFRACGFVNVETCQIPDDTPIPENFESGVHWRSREQREQFQQAGVLLITATKPDLPPPGPIEVDPDAPGPIDPDPDPFRIVG